MFLKGYFVRVVKSRRYVVKVKSLNQVLLVSIMSSFSKKKKFYSVRIFSFSRPVFYSTKNIF